MRICYLILCHKNEQQINSLIKQLDDKDVTFCIHVDKKAQLDILSKNNIYFVDDQHRIDIKWGDMGMVTATLNLIKLAIEHGPYDYVVLLSGQDYPIKNKEQINNFLSLHNGTNFIDVNTDSDKLFKRMLKRVELYYPKWMLRSSLFSRMIRKVWIMASGGVTYTFKPFRRKLPCNLKYAYGSQWWVLSYAAIKWMNQFVEEHSYILFFFENSLVPDECFFQMLFLESPYVGTHEKKLTYVEWENNRNHPRVLLEDDIPMLLRQQHLFARKFDVNIDSSVINALTNAVDG